MDPKYDSLPLRPEQPEDLVDSFFTEFGDPSQASDPISIPEGRDKIRIDPDIQAYISSLNQLRSVNSSSRIVIMVNERHDMPRLEYAKQIESRIQQQSSLSSKFFLEALYNNEKEIFSDIGAVGTTDQAITAISFPLSLVRTSLLMSRGMAALNNQHISNYRSIIEEVVLITKIHLGSSGRPFDQVSEADAKEALVLNFIHSVQKNAEAFRLDPEEIADIAQQSLNLNKLMMVPTLTSLCSRVIKSIDANAIECLNSLATKGAHFLGTPLPRFEVSDIDALSESIASDLIKASSVDALLTIQIQNTREMLMAYFIAKEKFDIAVFNCGGNHGNSEILSRYLEKKGVYTKAEFLAI